MRSARLVSHAVSGMKTASPSSRNINSKPANCGKPLFKMDRAAVLKESPVALEASPFILAI